MIAAIPRGSPFGGGTSVLVLGGLRIGTDRADTNVFLKARIGGLRSEAALRAIPEPGSAHYAPAYASAYDIGLVVERRITKRLALRVDAGDLIVSQRAATITIQGVRIKVPAPGIEHRIQLMAGLGWRAKPR
ncbi:MAG: hypothetical protein H0W06_05025 [Chloroflexia bacterium]|nr:hypothetical protein [Chloroflexia bacterium]